MRLFLAFLVLASVLVAGAAGLALLSRDGKAPTVVNAHIGAAEFAFAAAYARDEATAAGGAVDRIALLASFPTFSPSTPADRTSAKGRGAQGTGKLFITISPADEGVEPADRPARLYARFLEGDALLGPGGLVMRRFEPGSPYDLEQLYIAPPSGKEFFARCLKAGDAETAAADFCLWLFRADGLDVELRFSAALLEHWEALSEGARDFFTSIRAAGGKR
jgi:hypothetical protein